MKIVHIVGTGRVGGIETHVLTLSLKQREMGHNVSMIIVQERGDLSNLMEEKGFPVYYVDAKSGHDLAGTLRLRKLCKQFEAEVFHSHGLKALSFLSLGGLRKLRVNTVHCLEQNSKGVFLWKYLSAINRWAIRFTDGFIAVSKDIRDRLAGHGAFTNCPWQVIFNGIDKSKFYPDHDVTLPEKESDQPIELLMVSRMTPDKHPDDVIKVLALLREQHSLNVRLTLCGDGIVLPECKKLAEELGMSEWVTFAGRRNDVNEFMRRSHGMFMVTDYEAFPQVPIEGVASGCPVFAYHVPGGFHEWFKAEGCGGVISEQRTPKSLVEKILPILTDKNRWEQIRKDAIATAESFSDVTMAEKTVSFYRELLS